MKFLPLIWAWSWQKPVSTLMGLVAVATAFALYGLALGMAESVYRIAAARHIATGPEFLAAAMGISAIGMALILFLTSSATSHSVRLRIAEFGVLKAIGYKHGLILAMVAAQSVLNWLVGAAMGLAAAKLLYAPVVMLVPPLAAIPSLAYTPAMLASAALLAMVIGALSVFPASHILRVEVVTALAGGLRTPAMRDGGALQKVRGTLPVSLTAAAQSLRLPKKTETHLFRQTMAVSGVGLSTLRYRLKGARTVIVAVGIVAFVLTWGLSASDSIRLGLLTSGDPARVMLVQTNPPWIRSKLPPQLASSVAIAPGVAHARDGAALVEGQYRGNTKLIKRNNGNEGTVNILGVGPNWQEMAPEFRLLTGRVPRPGAKELIAGNIAWEKFSGLDDDQVAFLGIQWRVVGTFTASPWISAYLLGDTAALKAAANQPHDNFVLVRLTAPEALAAFRQAVTSKLPPGIIVQRETDFYAGIWKSITETAQALSLIYVVAGLAALGATAAMMHVMQVAVEERARDIAVLRALGFGGIPVALSLGVEAMLLSLLGVAMGAAVQWLCFDGILYNGAYNVFRSTINLHVLLVAISWGLLIALAGVIRPALALARQAPIEAIRESS